MKDLLPGYLRRRVGLQVVALLAVLTALMQVLELLDVTTDILERGQGLRGLLYYAMLRTPAEIVLALPLAVLLGTMSSLHAMARTLEVTAIRAAGISLMRILVYLLPVPLALALAQFALSETVLPRAEATLKQWWEAHAPLDEDPDPRWVHTQDGPLRIARASADGRELRGLQLYARDADGHLRTRTTATSASWDKGRWMLRDVRQLDLASGDLRQSHEDLRPWTTNLRPDDVLRLDVARPHLSSMMLADVIAGSRVGTQPRSYYQTILYRSFTAPLGVFVMLLLALPTAAGLSRGNGGGREMVRVLALGLGFLLCDGMIAALGTSGRLPAWLTALAAPAMFVLIGLLHLKKYDRL